MEGSSLRWSRLESHQHVVRHQECSSQGKYKSRFVLVWVLGQSRIQVSSLYLILVYALI